MKRIYHTWDKWECYPAGFHNKKGLDATLKKEDYEKMYADFLKDTERFKCALGSVINEWVYSCQHNLTNATMNRIAWLGQASLSYELGIPSCYRAGYFLLSAEQQKTANETALEFLNPWMFLNGYEVLDMQTACAKSIAVQY